ncbi:MAG: tetratricopeptide repeat protein [Actinobacteria bacterium]|nr:tetratricopeptide repeat protein [Actinomycetota bacterium]MCG2808388.1 tetratricopeptide repeat protein [Coriobacteriia bacterium]
MSESSASASVGARTARNWIDPALAITASILVLAILAVGGYFAYSVYQNQLVAEDSTPALRALKVLREQVKKSPNDALLRVRYGEALASAGKSQDSVEQFNAALQIDPTHTGAYLDLGIVALGTEHPSEARNYFLKVIELTEGGEYQDISDRRELALYNLGILELRDGQYEEAAGYFKGALRIRKDASDTYYHLALALQGMGQPETAIQQLDIALQFDPNYAAGHYLMGQLYMELDDRVRAAYHYGRAAQLEPDAEPLIEALDAIGTSAEWEAKARKALANGDGAAALEAATIASYLDPGSISAIKLRGQLLIDQGKTSEALEVYELAAKSFPKDKAIAEKISTLKGENK